MATERYRWRGRRLQESKEGGQAPRRLPADRCAPGPKGRVGLGSQHDATLLTGSQGGVLGWDRGVSERSVGTLSNNEMHLTRSAMVLGAALAGDLGVRRTFGG